MATTTHHHQSGARAAEDVAGSGNGHGAAVAWRFARAAREGALAAAGDKMSIRAVRFKISASVDARDPRPVLPLAHGDPSTFPAFRTAAEAEAAVAAALRTGKLNCYPAGVGLPDARRYVRSSLSGSLSPCLLCLFVLLGLLTCCRQC
jgi:tyrosine aminotransferase/nicotianamine aminotransferase